VGLVHGRLAANNLVLTARGVVKLAGFGEPPWLAGGPAPAAEPTAADDLRALGQVAAGWLQAGRKKEAKAKPLPAGLQAVLQRLTGEAEPYESAAALLEHLDRA